MSWIGSAVFRSVSQAACSPARTMGAGRPSRRARSTWRGGMGMREEVISVWSWGVRSVSEQTATVECYRPT